MKQIKIYFTALLAGLLILSSCTKTSQPEVNGNQSEAKVDKTITRKTGVTRASLLALSPSARRAAYNTLTPAEKHAIWVDKQNQVMGLTVWNTSQTTELNNIFNQLSTNLFTAGSTENINFKNTFAPAWRTSALPHFNVHTIYRIVGTLDDIDPNYLNDDQYDDAYEGDECKCSTGSDWCFGSIIECSGEMPCQETNTGCGTFWAWACDGTCETTITPGD